MCPLVGLSLGGRHSIATTPQEEGEGPAGSEVVVNTTFWLSMSLAMRSNYFYEDILLARNLISEVN
jgi:hypothetical protein